MVFVSCYPNITLNQIYSRHKLCTARVAVHKFGSNIIMLVISISEFMIMFAGSEYMNMCVEDHSMQTVRPTTMQGCYQMIMNPNFRSNGRDDPIWLCDVGGACSRG